MKLPIYKFSIKKSTDGVPDEYREIVPHYKSISKKYTKENNQQFFRETLEGKINLYGDDYDFIKSADIESKFTFTIEKINNNTNIKYFEGTFAKSDCKFDTYKKECNIKISAIDSYTNILNNYENTYDLIKLAPAKTSIDIEKRPLIQVYISGGNTASHFAGGTYWESDVIDSVNDHNQLVNTFHFTLVHNYNEMQMSPNSVEVPSQYTGSNGVYVGNNGKRILKVVKVASAYDKYVGKYAKDIAYDLETGAQIRNHHDNFGGSQVFIQDIYVLRLFEDNRQIAESDPIFLVHDVSKAYIKGFTRIPMTRSLYEGDIYHFTIENIFLQGVYSRLLCDVNTVEGLNTYDLPANDFIQDNSNYKRCIGLKSGLGNVYMSSATTDVPTKYGKNDSGKYFTDNIGGIHEKLYPICRSSWVNTSIWFEYSIAYFAAESKYRKKYTMKDGIFIADAIKALLKQIDPNISHEATAEYSQFLYDTTKSPIGLQRFYTFITQKTNILKGEYDQAAQKAEISFKELMDMLRDCFRCYWFIDDGKLKIEHIQYFKFGMAYPPSKVSSQLDLNGEEFDAFNGIKAEYFQGELEYDKSELSSRYEFNWMDDCTDLFSGITIDVTSNYIQQDKTEEINISKFTSDIDYMLFSPSSFSDDGFALMNAVKTNGRFTLPVVETDIVDENKRIYKILSQNWYASWLYLIQAYAFDLPARRTKLNYGPQNLYVRGIKQCMKHDISFFSEEDPEMYKSIITSIGDGIIEDMSVNIDNRVVKAKLAYEPK